ncbi:hypothetical protein [Aestuariibaculum lutulentum]|uniref:Lipoprotein n=1 Tax=Aestuariibaculum lutulentum TaxID=2920935 RepID=A0ABS9RH03_9FLAO|nr:hypothetical protein [Aestuariibaculum lutulentum]MCH4552223.1 hypothetical protein [Aestuariibaculum lutulentum]
MRIQNKNILASILFVLISFVCLGQPDPPPPTPPPGLSVDFGIFAVLSFGVFYGSKKLLSKKN